ncbi:hypothetical protein IW15_17985 [Chryseobacterium soli]|uniref:Uncharacterized protein n=1 Tax=Chryseobacterium soli TaxID=445961 RepID=A0A086A2Y6_9FLAO|nr:hypothetical protein [Chryseobacterium soli]KFF11050.1 hypothetical protein IW15_17985 [Chryseobacterium soli]
MKKRINAFTLLLQLMITGVLTFVESYWAMKPYDNQPSSSCLDCILELDLFWLSAITIIIIGLFLLISNWLKMKKPIQLILNMVILIGLWLWINNITFIEREASWSTFTTTEEWISTLWISFFPILVCGSIYFCILYFLVYKKLNEKI